ncbi:polysaccharide pyruvyl transferase family protein [Lactococcus formosensis]|uniref:polysaccharide pyruvyl transferase family protein n=1 Tax=Lactococcus formosensis TaxID=1281486 RepID=UPI001BCFF5E9|nr:polysaccharide pyruvyl transferase family protein [Lactococcus formosensis]
MKKVKLFYAANKNMGDELSKVIVEELFHLKVEKKITVFSDLFAIGSILDGMVFNKKSLLQSIVKTLLGRVNQTAVYIWGSGFITNDTEGPFFYRKNMQFRATRGKLTQQKAEEILGKPIHPVYGDAGILASELIKEELPIQKKYKWGIIPHFVDKKHPAVETLRENLPNSTVIDVRSDPKDVIREIAKCEYILSSSMHGLIIADSLNVPNHHIVITDKVTGDNFKFRDYYSAFGLEHHFTNIVEKNWTVFSDEFMKESYEVTEDMVKKMKEDMSNSFPKELLND